jgi:hypothetical protein
MGTMKRSDFLKALGGFAIAFSGVGKLAIVDAPVITVEAVNAKYLASYTQFSKQLMRNLPYLQATLPGMMLRDFSKAENTNYDN